MHFTGLTYRPPFEAHSLLLQATTGCSHNRCAFCTMYRDVPFRAEPIEQVEEDLREASVYKDIVTRVFLENGDPFALSADWLKEIAGLIHRHLPNTETIAMYASIKNIMTKTDRDLTELRQLGINELNIGVESGLDSVLAAMNKGYTAAEAREALLHLQSAGMDWGANIIFGAAGSGHGRENAEATASLLNDTKPYLIFTGTIHADKGCSLYEDMQSGHFTESTIREYLEEQRKLLSMLTLENCFWFGLHPSNVVPMQGWLGQDRDEMLREIDKAFLRLAPVLGTRPRRGGEGAIL